MPKLRPLKQEIAELDCNEDLGYGKPTEFTNYYSEKVKREEGLKIVRKLKWERVKKIAHSKSKEKEKEKRGKGMRESKNNAEVYETKL